MYSSVQCVVLSYVRFSTVVYIKHHHPELSLDSFALRFVLVACSAVAVCVPLFLIVVFLCVILLLHWFDDLANSVVHAWGSACYY